MPGVAPSDIFLFEDFRRDRRGEPLRSDSGALVSASAGCVRPRAISRGQTLAKQGEVGHGKRVRIRKPAASRLGRLAAAVR